MEIKRYLVWRHDGAIGNTAEQVLGLTLHLRNLTQPKTIITEFAWQKTLILASPVLRTAQIEVIPGLQPDMNDKAIIVPDVYREDNSYPSSWERLIRLEGGCLSWPQSHELTYDVVVMFKSSRFRHRSESMNLDSHRRVSERKYSRLTQDLARSGFSVARIGGPEQRPLPAQENVYDFRGVDPTLKSDLDLISSCKVAVFSDSGLWPIAAALGKLTIVSDVVSDAGNYFSTRFLPFIGFKLNRDRTEVFGWTGENVKVLRKPTLSVGRFTIFLPMRRKQLKSEIIQALKSPLL